MIEEQDSLRVRFFKVKEERKVMKKCSFGFGDDLDRAGCIKTKVSE